MVLTTQFMIFKLQSRFDFKSPDGDNQKSNVQLNVVLFQSPQTK